MGVDGHIVQYLFYGVRVRVSREPDVGEIVCRLASFARDRRPIATIVGLVQGRMEPPPLPWPLEEALGEGGRTNPEVWLDVVDGIFGKEGVRTLLDHAFVAAASRILGRSGEHLRAICTGEDGNCGSGDRQEIFVAIRSTVTAKESGNVRYFEFGDLMKTTTHLPPPDLPSHTADIELVVRELKHAGVFAGIPPRTADVVDDDAITCAFTVTASNYVGQYHVAPVTN